jgi:hypothetical protein
MTATHRSYSLLACLCAYLSATDIDPYAYTSGRWLQNDTLNRDARYISFNFDALCQKAVGSCPGASSIASLDKIEGGFSRVFIFTMDNGQRVVAKIPFPIAGPPKLTTASEVATIQYRTFELQYRLGYLLMHR